MPGTLSGGERAKLALAILASSDATCCSWTNPQQLDPASVVHWRDDAQVEGHDCRGEPRTRFRRDARATHAVLLPEEYFDLWNDDYMDLIEQR